MICHCKGKVKKTFDIFTNLWEIRCDRCDLFVEAGKENDVEEEWNNLKAEKKNVDSMNLHQVTDSNLLNLNGNMLCCIEIITTGPLVKHDNLIQVCILPLNSEWQPHKGIIPFYTDIIPKRPENIDLDNLPKKVNRKRVTKASIDGKDAYIAADLFEDWFERIRFMPGKKLSIIAYDWHSKKDWLVDWLGPTMYDKFFDYRYRDPLPAALFANDVADMKVNNLPYPKLHFQYLCSETKTESDNTPDCLSKCLSIAELYVKMVQRACWG